MPWFWIAILPPIFWSITNHIDKYLFDKYYHDALPGSLMFLTSIMGAIFAGSIAVLHHQVFSVPFKWQLFLIAAGAVNFCYIFPYIYALMRDEASRVVPLFQIAPIVSYLLAWAFLHEQLSSTQIVAGLLIVLAAVSMNFDLDNHFRLKKQVLILMIISASLFALEGFMFKYAAIHTGFWSGIFYQYFGIALSGLVLAVVSRNFRHSFSKILKANKRAILAVSVINEILVLLALISFNYASLLAPLALVALVSNTGPFFVILFGIILTFFFPQLGRENLAIKHLAQKILCSALIFTGTIILLR